MKINLNLNVNPILDLHLNLKLDLQLNLKLNLNVSLCSGYVCLITQVSGLKTQEVTRGTCRVTGTGC